MHSTLKIQPKNCKNHVSTSASSSMQNCFKCYIFMLRSEQMSFQSAVESFCFLMSMGSLFQHCGARTVNSRNTLSILQLIITYLLFLSAPNCWQLLGCLVFTKNVCKMIFVSCNHVVAAIWTVPSGTEQGRKQRVIFIVCCFSALVTVTWILFYCFEIT